MHGRDANIFVGERLLRGVRKQKSGIVEFHVRYSLYRRQDKIVLMFI